MQGTREEEKWSSGADFQGARMAESEKKGRVKNGGLSEPTEQLKRRTQIENCTP